MAFELTMEPNTVLNTGSPDLPVSTPSMLELHVCATILGLYSAGFLTQNFKNSRHIGIHIYQLILILILSSENDFSYEEEEEKETDDISI